MASKKTTVVETTMPESIGIFKAAGIALASSIGIITHTAATLEKSVCLVEKEVDNLHLIQDKRIEESRAALNLDIA